MRAKATRIATPPPLERAVALRILMAETLADDFAAFAKKGWTILHPHRKLVWSWHYDYLCELLTLVKQRKLLRLIVNVPPTYPEVQFDHHSLSRLDVDHESRTRFSHRQ